MYKLRYRIISVILVLGLMAVVSSMSVFADTKLADTDFSPVCVAPGVTIEPLSEDFEWDSLPRPSSRLNQTISVYFRDTLDVQYIWSSTPIFNQTIYIKSDLDSTLSGISYIYSDDNGAYWMTSPYSSGVKVTLTDVPANTTWTISGASSGYGYATFSLWDQFSIVP